MANVRSQSWRLSLMKLLPPPTPALLMTRSTWSLPCSLSRSWQNCRTCDSSETSHVWAVTRTSAGAPSRAMTAVAATASPCQSHAATEHPSAASWRTSSRPIPEPPPVTTASFPAKESIARHLPSCREFRLGWMRQTVTPRAAAGHRARRRAGARRVLGAEPGEPGSGNVRAVGGGVCGGRAGALTPYAGGEIAAPAGSAVGTVTSPAPDDGRAFAARGGKPMDPVAIGPRGPRVPRPKPLLRNILGDVLRRTRLAQGRTLADVARTARVSMPYLSELERGRKEASSEILAAICEALHIGLSDLLAEIQRSLGAERAPVVPLDAVRSARISAPVHQPGDVHPASPGGQAVPGPGDVTCLLAA